MRINATLCFIYQHPRLLLGMKKRGFGEGKWNGFGGKVEENESIEAAVRREVREEISVEVRDLVHVATLTFVYPQEDREVVTEVFLTNEFVGTPIETEEMRPEWHSVDALPFTHMWVDDLLWLRAMLGGKRFTGTFVFDDHETLASYELLERS